RQIDRLAQEAPVDRRSANPSAGTRATDLGIQLLRLAQEEPDDEAALQTVAARLAGFVNAGRVEFQAGPCHARTTIAASGTGLMPKLGRRALEAGIPIGPEQVDGVW